MSNLIRLSERGSALVVEVAAEELTVVQNLNRFNGEIRDLLQTRGETVWVFDFRQVTFMVSPALNALVTASKELRARGGRLIITGLNRNIRHIFELMRLDQLLDVRPDVESAVGELMNASGER